MTLQTAATPPRVLGLYDRPFWDLLAETGQMHLQCCSGCGAWRYPPGPACPVCLSPDAAWKPVSGGGELLSWVVFHKQYLPAYPAPHLVVAVRLREGPIMVSYMDHAELERIRLDAPVKLVYAEHADGYKVPKFTLAD